MKKLLSDFKLGSIAFAKPALKLTALIGTIISATIPSPAFAQPPEKGSLQMNRMSAHADFIKLMKRGDGTGCCDFSDGRMGDSDKDLIEEQVPDIDGGFRYRVFVKREVFGTESHNPENPPETINHAYDGVIPPEGKWFDIPPKNVLTREDATKNCPTNSTTCNPPAANVLWLTADGRVFCYYPVPYFNMDGAGQNTAIRTENPLRPGPLTSTELVMQNAR